MSAKDKVTYIFPDRRVENSVSVAGALRYALGTLTWASGTRAVHLGEDFKVKLVEMMQKVWAPNPPLTGSPGSSLLKSWGRTWWTFGVESMHGSSNSTYREQLGLSTTLQATPVV